MRRTLALFAVALASLAAAAMAAFIRPSSPHQVPYTAAGARGLRMQAMLERLHLPEDRATSAYLQIDLIADAADDRRQRVPVNAVLILDRSGSMSGPKIGRAREAAAALVQTLGPEDRLAIVEFSSEASVLLDSTPMTAGDRSRALGAVAGLHAMGGTNLSAAFELAAPQLTRGRGGGRVDKVFLASDGQANEGISDRPGLLRLARSLFANASLSTFGIGDDYDEDLMSALASQAGGRARYVDSPQILPGAFRAELGRAAAMVARDVRVRVTGLGGVSVERVIGYQPDAGWVRLLDFAAGEERRVLVKLAIPPGRGLSEIASVDLSFTAAAGEAQQARTVARAPFTSDPGLLAQAPTEAATTGASAEMAELAGQAARDQENGRRREARSRLDALRRISERTARAVPASSGHFEQLSAEYQSSVVDINAPGDAASKKLKARTFDAINAPVSGW